MKGGIYENPVWTVSKYAFWVPHPTNTLCDVPQALVLLVQY